VFVGVCVFVLVGVEVLVGVFVFVGVGVLVLVIDGVGVDVGADVNDGVTTGCEGHGFAVIQSVHELYEVAVNPNKLY